MRHKIRRTAVGERVGAEDGDTLGLEEGEADGLPVGVFTRVWCICDVSLDIFRKLFKLQATQHTCVGALLGDGVGS